MKLLLNNLLLLVLATVLSISPVQAIAAPVSDCLDTHKSMHHSMMSKATINKTNNNHSKQNRHQQTAESATQQDCCKTTACNMTHCASFVAIAITADTQNDMRYTLSEVYVKPSESFIPFYPSSLYRPPKA